MSNENESTPVVEAEATPPQDDQSTEAEATPPQDDQSTEAEATPPQDDQSTAAEDRLAAEREVWRVASERDAQTISEQAAAIGTLTRELAARDAGISVELAPRLIGETRDELIADAKKLAWAIADSSKTKPVLRGSGLNPAEHDDMNAAAMRAFTRSNRRR